MPADLPVSDPTADVTDALSRVRSPGREAGSASLRFFHGPMDCGKSTLALQIDHNQSRQGRVGLRLTRLDRAGGGRISSRIGLGIDAVELGPAGDPVQLVAEHLRGGRHLDYLVCDEAQFYSAAQVEALARVVDDLGIDVWCFGLSTDFLSRMFPGAQRLFELADEIVAIQVEVLCWCGRPGRQNSRVVDGVVQRTGDQVVVADTASGADVRYQVLCRRHWVSGDLGPSSPRGQLELPGD